MGKASLLSRICKLLFVVCAAVIFPSSLQAQSVGGLVASAPNNSNLWFNTIPDADIVSGNWTVGSSDTIAHPATIGIGDTAHFAFYYESSEGWYVNQGGTKVACPDDTTESVTPAPVLCATAPILVRAPNVRLCSINVPGDNGSNPDKRDTQLWLYTCADSSCSGIAQNINVTEVTGADSRPRGQSNCWDSSTVMGEGSGGSESMSTTPNSWHYVIKAPYQGASVLDAGQNGAIRFRITGLPLDPEEYK